MATHQRTDGISLTENSLERLIDFVGMVGAQTYPEAESALHTSITRKQLHGAIQRFALASDARILDVGCGQGPALDALREMGYRATGITINDEDLRACRAKGHTVEKMDQSFLDFPDGTFDLIWARHSVEHSFLPFFTLSGFRRVLKPEGYLYLEVPAPGTSCNHEENLNHYSVLSRKAWRSLLTRSGFLIDGEESVNLQTAVGPDEYFIFFCSTVQRTKGKGTGPADPAALYLALSESQNTGWGVCSHQMQKEFESRLPVVNLLQSKPDQSLQHVPGPMLVAISDRHLSPVVGTRGSTTFGYTFQEHTLKDDARDVARRYDRIFCGSTWCRDNLSRAGIHHVDVLIQGVNPTAFVPAPPRPDDGMFIVFSGGKFEYRKGQDLVLHAIQILQQKYNDIILLNAWRNVWPATMDPMKLSRHIKFELSGASWAEQMLHLYRLNGIDEHRIVTVDLISHATMPQLYAKTDIGVFPNRCEGGTNLVMMEYMATGKPVIATHATGHRDVVSRENALLLENLTPNRIFEEKTLFADWVEPSVDELVAQIEFAYHHRGAMRALGTQGASDMQKFTWAATAERALTLMGLRERKSVAAEAVPMMPGD
ncbi:MAG: methyltransferase domain-containing protein [Bacteroidota bacterium]